MTDSGTFEAIRKSTAIIVGLTLLDKILALAKEVLFAYRFGVAHELDVFNVAYAFPGIMAMLLSQAVISSLVPLYPEWRAKGGDVAARGLSTIFWACLGFFLAFSLAGTALAPTLFDWLGYGFGPGARTLGSRLEAMLIWLVFLEGAGAVLAGLLQAGKTFAVLYTAQLCLNLALIGVLLLWPDVDVAALAVGFLGGAALKLAVMAFGLRKSLGSFLHPRLFDKGVLKNFFLLAWPLIIGGLVGNSNILVDQVMGTELPQGSVSSLRYAYRINDLPVQLLVVALTRAIFPFISELATAGDLDGMRKVFWRGMAFICAVSLPVTAFIMLFSDQVVSLLLKRGAFGPEAAAQTALTLTCYSFGMFFYAYTFLNGVFFISLRRNKTLMVIGVGTMLANVFWNWFFMRIWSGPEAIAMSTTVTTGMTCLVFVMVIEKAMGVMSERPRPGPFLWVGGLCVLAFTVTWLAKRLAASLALDLLWMFPVLAALFGTIYLGGLYVSRDPELRWCLDVIAPFARGKKA